jgi:hypothetical protein
MRPFARMAKQPAWYLASFQNLHRKDQLFLMGVSQEEKDEEGNAHLSHQEKL